MADFGLAAQIGRGGGGGGMSQQQDPQNRMLQMMQLQQLQQNMMLARDQEARAAQLFPEQKRKLQVDIEGDQARTGVAIENRDIARLQREEIQRQQRINRGLISVMGMVDEGKLDLSTDAGFNQISDVELRMAARRQSAEIKEQNAKAEKAGYEANDVRRAQGYVFLDRTVPFIDGPATFNAALKKLLSVDPAAAEFVPNVYSPPNAQRLQEFVSTRRKSVQTIGGVPTLLNENTGVANELGIRNFNASTSPAGFNTISLPAGVQPPTRAQIGQFTPAEYGGVLATPQMGLDPARMAAGTPSDVGAMQSGIPGQRLPVAGGANFQSLGPTPASQFVAGREAAKVAATKQEALPKVQSAYKATVDSIDKQLRAIEEIESRPIGTYFATGPIAGSSFNPARVLPGDVLGVQGAQAQINNLKASGTLTALTELRRNSPTGSALGNSSDRDAEILERSDSALSQAQSTEDFMKAIVNKKRDLLLAKSRLGEAYASDYGAPPKVEGGPLSKELVRSGDTSVLLPNGKTLNFPSKDAVDAYMKKAGM